MTTLEVLYKGIEKEQRRIEMLANTPSNGNIDWYDFVKSETKEAKAKIKELQKQFDEEYKIQEVVS